MPPAALLQQENGAPHIVRTCPQTGMSVTHAGTRLMAGGVALLSHLAGLPRL